MTAGGSLEGRTAIITGGGQGVGRGIALVCAERGANVVIAARRAETGERVVGEITDRGGTAICIETNVTVRAAVQHCVDATVERFGSLEIMIHNAFKPGLAHRIEDVDEEFWWSFDHTGIWGSLYCAQAAFPHLRAAGPRGRLVFVTSQAGIGGSPSIPIQSVPKAAQRALAKSLAREWGQYRFTVNCMAPLAASPTLLESIARRPVLGEALEASSPLGRLGDCELDIGRPVAALVSDDGAYIHGQTLVCDGGHYPF